MTALDQAFIKAYLQRQRSGVPLSETQAGTIALDELFKESEELSSAANCDSLMGASPAEMKEGASEPSQQPEDTAEHRAEDALPASPHRPASLQGPHWGRAIRRRTSGDHSTRAHQASENGHSGVSTQPAEQTPGREDAPPSDSSRGSQAEDTGCDVSQTLPGIPLEAADAIFGQAEFVTLGPAAARTCAAPRQDVSWCEPEVETHRDTSHDADMIVCESPDTEVASNSDTQRQVLAETPPEPASEETIASETAEPPERTAKSPERDKGESQTAAAGDTYSLETASGEAEHAPQTSPESTAAMPDDTGTTGRDSAQEHSAIETAEATAHPDAEPEALQAELVAVDTDPAEQAADETPVGMPAHGTLPENVAAETPDSSDGTWRPPYQVDQFRWPETVLAFAERMGRRLQRELERRLDTSCRGSVLAVYSRHPGEGATTVSLALAKVMSATGRRTLLVDADLARGDLARRLRLRTPAGWNACIENGSDPGQCGIESDADRVDLLPATVAEEPSAVGQFGALAEFINSVRERYGLVIVDFGDRAEATAGVDAAEDDLAFVDAHLLVRDVREAEPDDVLLPAFTQRHREKWLGVVENFT